MNKITNAPLVKRNRMIANYSQIGVLVLFVGGLILSLLNDPAYLQYAFLAIMAGLICMNISNFFTARWGRNPPPDQAVDDLLKGFDSNYTIVHYRLGADHALFGPTGVWAILGKYEKGKIQFDGKKWKQTGVSTLNKLFGLESLGDPVFDAEVEAEKLSKKLKNILKTEITVHPLATFVNEKTEVAAENTKIPVLHASKVKEFFRHLPKAQNLTSDQMSQVLEYLGEKS